MKEYLIRLLTNQHISTLTHQIFAMKKILSVLPSPVSGLRTPVSLLSFLFLTFLLNGIKAQPKKFDNILYGVAYYQEYMPYERLEKDVQMMQEAGISVVRLGESTWSLF